MTETKKETPEKKKVTLDGAYIGVWKKFAVFEGRLSRRGYVYFQIMHTLIITIIMFIGLLLFDYQTEPMKVSYLIGIYGYASLIPRLAAGARRLHDTNKSGWLQLLELIPIIGGIVVLILCLQKGDQAENDYGPVPEE